MAGSGLNMPVNNEKNDQRLTKTSIMYNFANQNLIYLRLKGFILVNHWPFLR